MSRAAVSDKIATKATVEKVCPMLKCIPTKMACPTNAVGFTPNVAAIFALIATCVVVQKNIFVELGEH